MPRVARILALAVVALLAWRAWRVTVYEGDIRRGARAYEAGEYRLSLEHFEKALARSDADPLAWTWIGDAAGALHKNPPTGGWERARETALLERMNAGYAGAVLRCPVDAWSWSGIADAALRRARSEDLGRGVRLGDFDLRSRRLLDPWRAIAVGAAQCAVDLKPAGYLEFLGLMAAARLVVTDSGGIQEETTVLGVRCVTLRPNTERPVTIEEGTNRLAGTSAEGIRRAIAESLAAPAAGRVPELWDGGAARRIVDVLASELEG